jgi:hypothetical protein
VRTFSASVELATDASFRLTISFAWGISWDTWRFFALTVLILDESSGRWSFTGCSPDRDEEFHSQTL